MLGRASLETMPSLAVDLRKGSYPRAQADCPIVLMHQVSARSLATRVVVLDPVGIIER